MPVDSINRIPTLQVHQGTDTRDEKEKQRQGKKNKRDSESSFKSTTQQEAEDSQKGTSPESGQILDSAKTIQLLQLNTVEPRTLKRHAFLEMTHANNVKKPTPKNPNKLNKSA